MSPDTALAKFLVVSVSSDLIGVASTAVGGDAISESAAMQACTVTPEQPPAMEEAAIAGEIWILGRHEASPTRRDFG